MKKIIFATGNKDKMREIREIMADIDVEVVSMKEAGISVDVVEDGTTFEENALIKARAIAEHTDAFDITVSSNNLRGYIGIISDTAEGFSTRYSLIHFPSGPYSGYYMELRLRLWNYFLRFSYIVSHIWHSFVCYLLRNNEAHISLHLSICFLSAP